VAALMSQTNVAVGLVENTSTRGPLAGPARLKLLLSLLADATKRQGLVVGTCLR
jgi:hypothetical protein